MSDRHQRITELFGASRRLPSPERSKFLERECDGDLHLRMEVESLLSSLEESSFLEEGGVREQLGELAASSLQAEANDSRPEAVGPYKVLRLLGSGGMGIVYEAEQDEPRRKVALKVIRPGFVTPSLMSRFRHEAHVLGQLQHPGIAQIYDAGTDDQDGVQQPFYVMELVDGLPLLDYAESHDLNRTSRLELMASIAEAVHHAHRKGVVHRDLKPGNILVTDSGQPKILDFGVARVMDTDTQHGGMDTGTGQIVGTLPYMSPEQASGQASMLDARSDVFSLGVILFQILTDALPYEVGGMLLHDAAQVLQKESAKRAGAFEPSLRGDLETIIGTALQQDPARRYESARLLADDIRHYLAREPIVARPSSWTYRTLKFTLRNRFLIAGIAALIIGICTTTYQTVAANRAKHDAEVARQDAVQSLDEAQSILSFFKNMLGAGYPYNARELDHSIEALLDRTLSHPAQDLDVPKGVEAEVRTILGLTYLNLGRFDKADAQLRLATTIYEDRHGQAHANTLRALDALGRLHVARGDWDEGLSLYESLLAKAESTLGPNNEITLIARSNYATLLQGMREHVRAHEVATVAAEGLSSLLGDAHVDTAFAMNALAVSHMHRGDYSKAEATARTAYRARKAHFGSLHPLTVRSYTNMAYAIQKQERFGEAAILFDKIRDLTLGIYGSDHPDTLQAHIYLANTLLADDRPEDAQRTIEAALGPRWSERAEMDPRRLMARDVLGRTLGALGEFDEGRRIFEDLMADAERMFPAEHPQLAVHLANYGELLTEAGSFTDAETHVLRALGLCEREPRGSTLTREVLLVAIHLYEAWERDDEVERFQERLEDES